MKSDTKARAKTAAERLVAAGFGAMYERHGFQRVSATQYRMDRDGLVWRAVVGKGRPNDPNSFRDSVGFQIQGLPELLERLDEKWMPLKLPGTRIDVDWYTDSVDQAIEKELKPYYESRKDEPKTFWRWLFYKHPEPPVTLERRHPNIDHLFRGDGHLWDAPEDRPFQDFTNELIDLWETYVWPELENRLDLLTFIRPTHESPHTYDLIVDYIACQYLIGNHKYVKEKLAYIQLNDHYNPKTVTENLYKTGSLDTESLRRRGITEEDFIQNTIIGAKNRAQRAKKIEFELYGG